MIFLLLSHHPNKNQHPLQDASFIVYREGSKYEWGTSSGGIGRHRWLWRSAVLEVWYHGYLCVLQVREDVTLKYEAYSGPEDFVLTSVLGIKLARRLSASMGHIAISGNLAIDGGDGPPAGPLKHSNRRSVFFFLRLFSQMFIPYLLFPNSTPCIPGINVENYALSANSRNDL